MKIFLPGADRPWKELSNDVQQHRPLFSLDTPFKHKTTINAIYVYVMYVDHTLTTIRRKNDNLIYK